MYPLAMPSTSVLESDELRLRRLERQGLARRAPVLLPREFLMAGTPKLPEGTSALEALLAERREEER